MVEADTIYSSQTKYDGIFSFKDFYKFCYDWLTEETALSIIEKKYSEKIAGNAKEIQFFWEGTKEYTDYFKFKVKITFHVLNLTDVEINKEGQKIKTNKGSVKITVKGILERDYKGKFEIKPFYKFLRAIYEKWVITTRVTEFEDKVVGACDDFLSQAKAYLDIEGRK